MKRNFLKTALKQKNKNREKNDMYGTEAIMMLVIVILVIIILWQKTLKLIITWKIVKFILESLLQTVAEMEKEKENESL